MVFVLIGGSIKGFGNISYDKEIFLYVADQIGNFISNIVSDDNITMLFAGSPCSDCLSLQIGKNKGYKCEYHLPFISDDRPIVPNDKVMKEYNEI